MVDNNNNNIIVNNTINGRPSNNSALLNLIINKDHDHHGNQSSNHNSGVVMTKEQDRLLPIANVGRTMKQILPANAKVSKEAKETMQECATEFVSFVTGEASDRCRRERRKTVNGDDICWALQALGFDDYAGSLRRYVHRYREAEGDRANKERVMRAAMTRNGGSDEGLDLRANNSKDGSEE